MRYLHAGSRFSRGRDERSRSWQGFTVLEITIIVVVVAILASLAVVAYFRVTSKAENTEALNNLAAVRKAQVSEFAETGSYVNATDTAEINKLLPEADIQDKNFTYKIVNATSEDFAAVAERVGEDTTGEKPIEIAMYSDGHVDYAYSPGSSYGGGYGGSSGGGSGGGGSSGGGSSGGMSGGSSGSSSGGSSGSSSGGSSGGSSGDDSSDDSSSGGGSGSFVHQDLSTVLGLLQDTTNGGYYYDLVNSAGVTLSYADLGAGVLGMYIPTWWLDFYPDDPYTANTIYFNSTFLDSSWSATAIAAILVHEALHADYDHNMDTRAQEMADSLGIDVSELTWFTDPVTGEDVLSDSIQQEYLAFCQEALLWREIRGNETNAELDYVLSLYESDEELGTDLLYTAVAQTYAGYPLYELPIQ
ncbi:MAG: hypothetical protein PHO59_02060 [Candidatus Omnitrophica bacterium]|nr:hypothetical protein [Candidatus Omnitrophota bacterium]MDD5538316.1 hypothetical protein [Candidatus Omnitrophota bacterium]